MPDEIRISADELERRIKAGEEFTILDVRNAGAWAEARNTAKDAIRVPLADADQIIPTIPTDKPIVAYCT
jgi:rhodanese-related sulfurtransferase